MAKLVKLDPAYYTREDLGYWCPGCERMHTISVHQQNHSGARWGFDGNAAAPTFTPSINERINTPDMGKHYQPDIPSEICHHFVRAGQIQFLDDCTHKMKGTTVPLPDFPDGRHVTCERL